MSHYKYEGDKAVCRGKTKKVRVVVPADLSYTGKARVSFKPIDACISGLVKELNSLGVRTRASCCGHGKTKGRIDLEDGTIISLPKRG